MDSNALSASVECLPTPIDLDRTTQHQKLHELIRTAAQCLNSTLRITGYHEVAVLPPEIEHLTRLRTLTISHNYSLAVIPPEIETLVTLESCNLSYNALTMLTPELCRLRYLSSLDLGNNILFCTVVYPPPQVITDAERRVQFYQRLTMGAG